LALHTLEIIMKAQTGEVMSGLNKIENGVTQIVEQVKSLQSTLKQAINTSDIKNVVTTMQSAAVVTKTTASEVENIATNMSHVTGNTARLSDDLTSTIPQLLKIQQIADKFRHDLERSTINIDGLMISNISEEMLKVSTEATDLRTVLSAINEILPDAGGPQLLSISETFAETNKNAEKLKQIFAELSAKLEDIEDDSIQQMSRSFYEVNGEVSDVLGTIKLVSDGAKQAANKVKIISEEAGKQIIPAKFIDEQQAKIAAELRVYLTAAGKLTGQITDRNKEHVKLNYESLKAVVLQAEALKNQGAEFKKLADAAATLKIIERNMAAYSSHTEIASRMLKSMSQAWRELAKPIPGLANFAKVLDPLKMVNEELTRLNKLYEENHTVASVFIADSGEFYNVVTGMGTITADSAESTVLLQESHKALTEILKSGQAAALGNSEQISDLTESIAKLTRLTGLSGTEISKLQTMMLAYTGSLDAANRMNTIFINSQANGRLSSQQMSKMVNMLNNDFVNLNHSYRTVDEQGQIIRSGADNISIAFGELGRIVAETGGNASAAMDAFAKSMQDPVSMAPLLGEALFSTDPVEKMTMLNKRAAMFYENFKGNPILMSEFAKSIGISVDQFSSLGEAGIKQQEDVKALAKEYNLNMADALERYKESLNEKMADEQAANKLMNEAYGAIRRLTDAFDGLVIKVSRIIVYLEPLIEGIAWILSSDIVQWTLLLGGGIIGLVGSFKLLIPVLGMITKSFAGLGAAAKALVTGQFGANFGDSIKSFIEKIGSINAGKALMAAGTIALVGAALAGGISLIALSMNLMPPDRVAELAIILGTLMGSMLILALLGTPQVAGLAMLGALALALVGAALAGGISLIGLAMGLMPSDRVNDFLILVTGLLAATGVLALIGLVGTAALVGAVALTGIATALSVSVAIIAASESNISRSARAIKLLSESINKIKPTVGLGLMSLSAGVMAFAASMSTTALTGFIIDFDDAADSLANSMNRLVQPIARLSSIGPENAKAFRRIGQGLNEVSESISKGGLFEWFSGDKVENAEKLAEALWKINKPIEELKSSLTLDVNRGDEAKEDAVLDKLEEIRLAVVNNSPIDSSTELKEMNDTLKKLLDEMYLGGGSLGGSSTADTAYAV
jgi:hypothetical protein